MDSREWGPGRRACAALTALTAAVTWSVSTSQPTVAVAAPAAPSGLSLPSGPCALPRTGVHHSEGLDSWHPDYPVPRGELRVALIFLAFPDSEPRLSPARLAADHFPATREFFHRASYGRLGLRVEALSRWLVMPRPSGEYGISRDWDAGLRDRYLRDAIRAADDLLDFRRYDMVHLVADPDAPGVDSDATKVVNLDPPLTADGHAIRRFGTVFEKHPPDHNVLAHETAHVFDLPDLYSRPPAGSNADWDTHVGDWDLMGSQFGLSPDLLAWHKWKLGWLDPGQVDCVSAPGTTVHRVTPVETPGGKKMVAVRTGPSTVHALEVRSTAGNNATSCTTGVLVYRVRNDLASGDGPVRVLDGHPRTSACRGRSVYPPLADAPLRPGETLRTGKDVGVTVRVERRHPDGSYSVRVTRERTG
ncbi:M6 family metalloprotease domain-containing protein [Streptomyces sp. HB2AG]|uniref:M6 family metalloprotease domain-containing protein n=1 Tax=Streptomyces sp. HB2AG TaxID=2983400 RepID=UPI0022AB4682|nr:M6 family metalloprotease domain-containing protein [Streptomyces sp. HB2AG]MCZ2523334.1 M6 family metalloprotease domain-containing protein [Streptomyces sp. HB2AG]